MARPFESILITGSGGFTGLRLASALIARGDRVAGFGREVRHDWERIADLNDEAAVREVVAAVRPDVVVHLAGISSPAHPAPADFYTANVNGTLHLLRALEDMSRPRLVIVASSAAVYQLPNNDAPLVEAAPLVPGSHYGVSKLTAEHVARLFSRRLPIQIVRPFNYTGTGQRADFLVPKLVDHFARDAGVIEVGNLNLHRDISAVDDIVKAYLRIIDREPSGSPLNLCSGHTIHLSSIVTHLEIISGRSMKLKVNPNFVRAGEPFRLVGSRDRLDAAIGVWPRRSIQSLLSEMYAFATTAEQNRPG